MACLALSSGWVGSVVCQRYLRTEKIYGGCGFLTAMLVLHVLGLFLFILHWLVLQDFFQTFWRLFFCVVSVGFFPLCCLLVWMLHTLCDQKKCVSPYLGLVSCCQALWSFFQSSIKRVLLLLYFLQLFYSHSEFALLSWFLVALIRALLLIICHKGGLLDFYFCVPAYLWLLSSQV